MTRRLRSGPLHRRLSVAVIATAAIATAPPHATAAIQIGQTFAPDDNFSSGRTALQSSSPGGQYAVPSPGVITSWSHQAHATQVPQGLKLKVARPAGGNAFTIVGESGPQNPIPGVLNTYFDVAIPVQPGDVIGLYTGSVVAFNNKAGLSCGLACSEHELSSDVAPGATATFGGPFENYLFDISAILEPDCDGDGFGDETQDDDISPCIPKTDRTLTLDSNKGKVEKGRKVRLTGQIDAPLNEAACEPNQTVELQRKKTKAPDTAFATFRTVQTDQVGNFAEKVKVKKTRVYRAVVQENAACDEELSNTQKVRVQKKKAAQEA